MLGELNYIYTCIYMCVFVVYASLFTHTEFATYNVFIYF